MNKKTLQITSIHNTSDRNYWKKQPYNKRIAALEKLRRIIFGYAPFTDRLQRVFTVTKLKKD